MAHSQSEPLSFSAPGEVFVSSDIKRSKLSFSRRFDKTETSVGIYLQNHLKQLTLVDTSELSLGIEPATANALGFSLHQPWHNHSLSLDLWLSQSGNPDSLSVSYGLSTPRIQASVDYAFQRSDWNLILEDPISSIPVSASYGMQAIGSNISANHGSYFLGISAKSTIHSPNTLNADEYIHTRLNPVQRMLSVKAGKHLHSDSEISFYYHSMKDTVNADIQTPLLTVGSIYAFDRQSQSTGLRYERNDFTLDVSLNEASFDVSGSVLASHFSDLLSSLSGARYYHQLLMDARYVNFKLEYDGSVSNKFSMEIKNEVLIGKGSLYSKRYAFVLFNPLSNLSIREITLHRGVLNNLNLDAKINVGTDLVLNFNLNYLLPLYVDITSKPDMEVKEADIVVMRSLGLGLGYTF